MVHMQRVDASAWRERQATLVRARDNRVRPAHRLTPLPEPRPWFVWTYSRWNDSIFVCHELHANPQDYVVRNIGSSTL